MTVKCLTDAQKYNICEEYYTGSLNKTEISIMYNVSRRTISRVIDEYTYDEQCIFKIESARFEFYPDEVESDDKFYSYDYTISNSSITITKINKLTGDCDIQTLNKSNPNFTLILDDLCDCGFDDESIKRAFADISIKDKLSTITNGKVTVDVENCLATYDLDNGQVYAFSGNLLNRLVDAASNGNANGMLLFANKLMNNPSNRSITELYNFLEALDIKITDDGMVECYKRITDDYKDCYTKTIDNNIGSIVEVPRNMVDENSEQTCSHGLHVCSFSYLKSFYGDRVVKVLVDPADFVAVPIDYNNAKARVCKYKVINEITEKYFAGKAC